MFDDLELIEFLLVPRHGISDRLRSSVITSVLSATSLPELTKKIHRAVMVGTLKIDVALLRAVQKPLSVKSRIRTLRSTAMLESPSQFFLDSFLACMERPDRQKETRQSLSGTLHIRLNLWPHEADSYEQAIRKFFLDRDAVVARDAIPGLVKLSSVNRHDVARLFELISNAHIRLSASSGLLEILHRHPELLRECTDDDWRRVKTIRSDEDIWVRRGARRLLRLRKEESRRKSSSENTKATERPRP